MAGTFIGRWKRIRHFGGKKFSPKSRIALQAAFPCFRRTSIAPSPKTVDSLTSGHHWGIELLAANWMSALKKVFYKDLTTKRLKSQLYLCLIVAVGFFMRVTSVVSSVSLPPKVTTMTWLSNHVNVLKLGKICKLKVLPVERAWKSDFRLWISENSICGIDHNSNLFALGSVFTGKIRKFQE